MELRVERIRASRVIAVASALLLTVANVQLAFGLAWFGAQFSDHAHVLSSASDGSHLDLVLSHDAAGDAHDHGPAAHLHSGPADDHVVHLTSDPASDSRRAQAGVLATEFAESRPMIAPTRVASARPALPARPVLPFSRRSVVLRT